MLNVCFRRATFCRWPCTCSWWSQGWDKARGLL